MANYKGQEKEIHEEFFEKIVEPALIFMKQEIESKYNKGVKIHISPTGIATSGKGSGFASLTIYSEALSEESKGIHPLARTKPDEEFRYTVDMEISKNNIIIDSAYHFEFWDGKKYAPYGNFRSRANFDNIIMDDIVEDIRRGLLRWESDGKKEKS
jgi:hypothetical protein